MTPLSQFLRGSTLTKLLIVSTASIFWPALVAAQTSGPTVDACNYGIVDADNDVSESVCVIGNQSTIYGSNEVDTSSPQYSQYLKQVGARAVIYDNTSGGIYDSDWQLWNPSNQTSIAVQGATTLNDVYTLTGYAAECWDYSGAGSNCEWSYPANTVSIQVQITPANSSNHVTSSNTALADDSNIIFGPLKGKFDSALLLPGSIDDSEIADSTKGSKWISTYQNAEIRQVKDQAALVLDTSRPNAVLDFPILISRRLRAMKISTPDCFLQEANG